MFPSLYIPLAQRSRIVSKFRVLDMWGVQEILGVMKWQTSCALIVYIISFYTKQYVILEKILSYLQGYLCLSGTSSVCYYAEVYLVEVKEILMLAPSGTVHNDVTQWQRYCVTLVNDGLCVLSKGDLKHTTCCWPYQLINKLTDLPYPV